MIVFIEGTLVEKNPARVVVNAAGIGYEVFITLSTYEDLPMVKEKVKLFTYHATREDSETLYGFSSPKECDFFETLIGVSGIGPSLALNVLSGLPIVTLCAAIAEADVKQISRIKGVGKKTAERMIVELRDKVSPFASAESTTKESAESAVINDAVLALIALGYKNADAYSAVKKVCTQSDSEEPVEVIVRRALGSLS